MSPSLHPLVDAIYRLNEPSETWLESLARAALIEASTCAMAWSFEHHGTALRMQHAVHIGLGPEGMTAWASATAAMCLQAPAPEHKGVVTWAQVHSCEELRALKPPERAPGPPTATPAAVLTVLARASNGQGVGLAICFETTAAETNSLQRFGDRLGSHLAAGLRLLTLRKGTSHHPGQAARAAPSLAEEACARRDQLRDLAVHLDRAPTGPGSPGQAFALWSAFLEGEWSLVDHFQRRGRNYVIVECCSPRSAATSARHERQALALRVAGYPLKAIAHELNFSASNVSINIKKCLRRLGVASATHLTYRLVDG